MIRYSAIYRAVSLAVVLVLAASTAHAIDKCKVKIDKKNGTIQASASDVTGVVLWGTESGAETNALSNAGTCVVGTKAKKCELAADPDPARITPPELCTLYLKDDVPSQCSAYIKGCTPGVRNTGLSGEGFVKAWARINADGTIASCYNCNTDVGETQRLGLGAYEVDFTPLADDITSRPRTATPDDLAGTTAFGEITLANRMGDASSVFVQTTDSSGVTADESFVIVVY